MTSEVTINDRNVLTACGGVVRTPWGGLVTREQMIDEAVRRVRGSSVRNEAFEHLATVVRQAGRGLPPRYIDCFECGEAREIVRAEFRAMVKETGG